MRQVISFWMALAAAVVVLLAYEAMRTVIHQVVQEGPATSAEPTSSPYADVVLRIASEPTATPEPTPTPEPTAAPESASTPEPDKPIYDPAIPLSEDLQYILRDVCEEDNVELALALGVIEVESDFDPSADSGLCYGLMQLNRSYFPSGLPAGENLRYGVEYLGQLLARYDTIEAALTAYNAGHDTGSMVYANAVLAAAEKWRDIVWTS